MDLVKRLLGLAVGSLFLLASVQGLPHMLKLFFSIVLNRWVTLTLFSALLSCACGAQSLRGCKTIFVKPMPESLDGFVASEIVKWGAMKVVTAQEKADCIATFGNQASKIQVKSSGSLSVPKDADVTAEDAANPLPSSTSYLTGKKTFQAALQLVHQESSVMLWANSQSSSGGPISLARQLVDQLKKDYQKSK